MRFTGTAALEVASELVTGVGTALTTAGREVKRAFVTVGDVAWDACECGQLSVSVLRIATTESFPAEAAPLRAHCGNLVVVEYSVSLVRCVPTSDINGNPPTPAALTAAATTALLDADDVRYVVTSTLCALDDAGTISDYSVGEQTALGPLGGCGGTQLSARVAFTHCLAC